MTAPSDYVLGYTEAELKRLATQARLINPITQRFLIAAGIAEGMRVLEIGSGAGDVVLLLSDLVGPRGQVVGTDLSPIAVQAAERRVRAARLANITFRVGDPAAMTFEGAFDAVAGRYVLQFMPDPSDALRKIATQVRPGGVVVFHELDWGGARSSPTAPTYDLACGWVKATISKSGAQVMLGTRLSSLFQNAGLKRPTLRLESIIASGTEAIDAIRLVTDLVETLLPRIEELGVAGRTEVDISTLVDRIVAEVGTDGTIIGRSEVGAWTTV